jgi:hypothetical protein
MLTTWGAAPKIVLLNLEDLLERRPRTCLAPAATTELAADIRLLGIARRKG